MVSTINTFSATETTIRTLQRQSSNIEHSAEQLSTGNAITSPSDGAAELTIVKDLFRTEAATNSIRAGLEQAKEVMSTADGGMASLLSVLNRLSKLVTDAQNGSFSESQRAALNTDFSKQLEAYESLVSNTVFNGIQLLTDIAPGTSVQGDTQGIIREGTSTLTYSVPATADTPAGVSLNGVSIATLQDDALTDIAAGTNYAVASSIVAEMPVTPTADSALFTLDGITVGIGAYTPGANVIISAAATGLALVTAINDAASPLKAKGYRAVALTATNAGVGTATNAVNIYKVGSTTPTYEFKVGATALPSLQINGEAKTGASLNIGAVNEVNAEAILVRGIGATASANIAGFYANSNGLSASNDIIKETLSPITITDNAGTLTLQSKNAALTGNIILKDGAGVVRLGKFEGGNEAVGSLGVSNVALNGSLTGKGASWIKLDLAGIAVADTGAIDMNTASISDGFKFVIGGNTDSDGAITYTFKNNPNANIETEVQLETGNTYVTMLNLMEKLRTSGNPILKDLDFTVKSNDTTTTLQIKTKMADSSLNGLTFRVYDNATQKAILTLTNGKTTYSNFTRAIANSELIGSGKEINVSAKYSGANKVKLTLNFGNSSYTASDIDTKPSTDKVVRFVAEGGKVEGGYFDLVFAANQGKDIGSASDANQYASDFKEALSGLTFYQNRQITSYEPSNTSDILNGSQVEFISSSFTQGLAVSQIQVGGKSASNNGYITITLSDQRVFEKVLDSAGSTIIEGGSILEIPNKSNPNEKFKLHLINGIDMTSSVSVQSLQQGLSNAFKAGVGPMEFPMSVETGATKMQFAVENLSKSKLLGTGAFDLTDKSNLVNIKSILDNAISVISNQRTMVGANQSKANATIESLKTYGNNLTNVASIYYDVDPAQGMSDFTKESMKFGASVNVFKRVLQVYQQLLNIISQ